MLERRKNNYIQICIFWAILILFSSRVFFLDQDLPPWGLVNYTPVDEGSYSILALNKMNYGEIDPNVSGGEYSFYTPPHVRVNVIGNFISYLSLKLLGDNYYGLRMPYVLFAFSNFFMLHFILKKLRRRYGADDDREKLWSLGLLLLISCDFVFFTASRVAEPTMLRLLFVQFVFWIFLTFEKRSKLKFYLLGLLITTSVFLVYITNVFLYLAVGMMLLYIWKKDGWKSFYINFNFFLLGIASVLIFSEAYYLLIWNTSGILNFFGAIFDFSAVSGYESSMNIKESIKKIIRFLSANSNLYNLPTITFFFFTFSLTMKSVKEKKDTVVLFLMFILLSFFLQTMVSEDYIVRKFICCYTLLIYSTFIALLKKKNEERVITLDKVVKETALRKLIKVAGYIFLMALVTGIVFFRIKILRDGTVLDFSIVDKLSIVILGWFPVTAFLIIRLSCLLRKPIVKISSSDMKKMVWILLGSTMILNLSFVIRYNFINQTYTERDAMMELGKIAGDRYVLGEYENGFTLYNGIKPVLNTYKILSGYLEKNQELLYFDYYDGYDASMRNFFDNTLFKGSNYTVLPVHVFERKFQTYGQKRNMALYKVATKRKAIKKMRKKFEQKPNKVVDGIKITNIYPDAYGDIMSGIYENIYVNIYGDIYGSIIGNIYGNIYGDVYGDIKGYVEGTIYGNVYGEFPKGTKIINKQKEFQEKK